jgi:poly(3-hydroxybutyrate) depolymerase
MAYGRHMDQLGERRRTTPWWYRVPHLAVYLITMSVAGIVVFTLITESPIAWAGAAIVCGLLANFFHGIAKAAHDERHPE